MKKILTLLSMITLMLTVSLCFSASAAEEKVVIDNVVYELTSQKYNNSYDYGEHYAVTDFFEDEALAETTTKINIVDEIDGIEVKVIDTNWDCDDGNFGAPHYRQKYPGVKKISIPCTVKYIGPFAFSFFPGIEKLSLPADLDFIDIGAFYTMESLKSITLPVTITSIRPNTFAHCKSLEKITLGTVSVWGYAFNNCVNLEAVIGDVISTDEFAFYNCEKLTSFNFCSVGHFGDWAFSNTGFSKVIIPENVKYLGASEDTFEDCKNLEKIVFEDTSDSKEDSISIDGYSMFYNCPNVKEIYIKAIPRKSIYFTLQVKDEVLLPKLETIYFAGSEEKWNNLTDEDDREILVKRGIKVKFYYRHSHNYTLTVRDATCSKDGKEVYSCECGRTKTYTYNKDANNHISDKWTVISNPTLTKEGSKKGYCNLCKKNVTVAIAKLKLDTPKNLKATQSSSVIRLTWDTVENATGYRIYQFNEETEKYEKIASVKGKTVYRVTGLEQGKKYMFKVKAYIKDKDGNTGWSKASSALKTGTEPGKVKITSATVTEKGEVKLTWTSAGEDVYYSIWCSTKKNGYEHSIGWTPDLSAEVKAVGAPNSYIKVYAYGVVYNEDGSKRVDITPETKVYDIAKVTFG